MPTLIGAAVATTALGLAAGSTAAIVVGTGVSLAASFALSYGANLLLSPDQAGGPAGDQGAKESVRQSNPSQRAIYGTVTTSGAFCFFEKKPPYIVISYLLAAHKVGGLQSVRMQGVRVFFDSNGDATSSPFNDGNTSYVRINLRPGTLTQTLDPVISGLFPDVPATFRQVGHAVATGRFHYGNDAEHHEELWGQNFDPLFRMDGKEIYDPRDPNQDVNDSATWKFSANSALIIADYIRSDYGGHIEASKIDWPWLIVAANICDEPVGTLSGDIEPRYTINAVLKMDQNPVQIFNSMKASMSGRVIWVDGKVRIIPGHKQEPVFTIHEGMLAGGFEFRSAKPRDQLKNIVRTEIIAPETDFQTTNGPVLKREDLIVIDGGKPEETTLRLPYIDSASRAQRLAKAFLDDNREGRSLNMMLNQEGLVLTGGTMVRVEFPNFPHVNGVYVVESQQIELATGNIPIQLDGAALNAFDFNPATDERPFEFAEINTEAA